MRNFLLATLLCLLPQIADAQGLGSTNFWTGDNFFGSGRPWADVREYGAVGDSSTDDTTAIQNAINHMQTNYAGGIVYFSPANGAYCVKSGISVSSGNGIELIGAGMQTTVSACGADVTTLTLGGNNSRIQNLTILGKGANPTDSFGATHPALLLNSCANCVVDHILASGGSNAIKISGHSGDWILRNTISNYAYGTANIYIDHASGWLDRVNADQTFPKCCQPVGATATIPVWQAGVSYGVGSIVSLSGWYIQCVSAGTSGASAPTLRSYGSAIVDGGATWNLLAPTTYYAIQLDTGAYQVAGHQVDMSGAYTAGLALTNTLSDQVPPGLITFTDSVASALAAGVYANAGSGLLLKGMTLPGCGLVQCQLIYLTSGWRGTASIIHNIMYSGGYGILAAGGTNLIVTDNLISGNNVTAFYVTPGISNFIFANNTCGSDANFGGANALCVYVSVGSSDHYNIVNNIISGATVGISDNGTGTNKTVSGNN